MDELKPFAIMAPFDIISEDTPELGACADDKFSSSDGSCIPFTSFRPYKCCCEPCGWSIGDVSGDKKSFVLVLLTLENTLAGVMADGSRGGHVFCCKVLVTGLEAVHVLGRVASC